MGRLEQEARTQGQTGGRGKLNNGKYSLKTNVYGKLKDFKDAIICTETLGKAFEPEQRFENPDGTDIVFDRDYFGNHRGTDTIPGPFASAEDAEKVLY